MPDSESMHFLGLDTYLYYFLALVLSKLVFSAQEGNPVIIIMKWPIVFSGLETISKTRPFPVVVT